jgi:hypothetical protein
VFPLIVFNKLAFFLFLSTCLGISSRNPGLTKGYYRTRPSEVPLPCALDDGIDVSLRRSPRSQHERRLQLFDLSLGLFAHFTMEGERMQRVWSTYLENGGHRRQRSSSPKIAVSVWFVRISEKFHVNLTFFLLFSNPSPSLSPLIPSTLSVVFVVGPRRRRLSESTINKIMKN